MTVLIDTNFLVSVLVANDVNHNRAVAALPVIKPQQIIVAAPVLIELFYLIDKYVNMSAMQPP